MLSLGSTASNAEEGSWTHNFHRCGPTDHGGFEFGERGGLLKSIQLVLFGRLVVRSELGIDWRGGVSGKQ